MGIMIWILGVIVFFLVVVPFLLYPLLVGSLIMIRWVDRSYFEFFYVLKGIRLYAEEKKLLHGSYLKYWKSIQDRKVFIKAAKKAKNRGKINFHQ